MMCSFVEKAITIHGGEYNYSLVDYINSYTPITVICKKHGEFLQKPSEHLRSKYPCPICRNEAIKLKLVHGYEEFVEKSYKLYGNLYGFEKKWYDNKKSSVFCKKHGVIQVNNRLFLEGKGCPKCGYDRSHNSRILTNEEFIDRAKKIHGEKYDYSNVDYMHNKKSVEIFCKKHGIFTQEPNNHLEGKGCPKCSFIVTKFHNDVQMFLDSIGINYKSNDRSAIKPNEIDILCGHVGIECHGLFWHSYDRPETKEEKFRHFNKCELAINKGIELIQIYENEWKFKKEVVKSIIKSKFNKNETVGARKCDIINLSFLDYKEFMDLNHIQGHTKNCSIRYGLKYNGNIVACIGFNKNRKYEWEISRYANVLNCNVVGGLSRLFNKFIKSHSPSSIITYSDRRYFNGSSYKKIGFVSDGVTNPGYCYTDKHIVYSRQKFQKRKLSSLFNVEEGQVTESDIMFNNGYRRIWDAGNNRMIWHA